MPLISLAMIVKNEEATLAHCLESVKPLVDEMVVVDTGSTDKTIEIAKGFGAKIYHFDWCDDFSAARNESLKHCTGDWVLILDADEAIDPLDYEKVFEACTNPFADGYALTHRNYLSSSNLASQDSAPVPNTSIYNEGKNLPFYADTETLRLAKNCASLAFDGKVHESLRLSIVSGGGSISKLNAVIHHYGKLFADREQYKTAYYLMLARNEAEKKPADKYALFNLLQQALNAGEWETAVDAAMKSLNVGHGDEPLITFGAGLALQQLDRHVEAIEYFDLLLDKYPSHALGKLRKGSSYMSLGNFNEGRLLMMEAIELEPCVVQSYGCLAELELGVNNIGAARNIALEALKLAPNEPDIYSLLLNAEVADNNYGEATRYALMGIENCPGRGKAVWYRVASAYLLKEGQLESGRSILESGLEAFPNDPELNRLKGLV